MPRNRVRDIKGVSPGDFVGFRIEKFHSALEIHSALGKRKLDFSLEITQDASNMPRNRVRDVKGVSPEDFAGFGIEKFHSALAIHSTLEIHSALGKRKLDFFLEIAQDG